MGQPTHVRYTIIAERPLDQEEYHGASGVGAARFFEHELRECGLPGEFAVVARKIEGEERFPLSEMGPGSALNAVNYQDSP